MAESAWKKDTQGYYVEMVVGSKKDWELNWSDFLPAGESIDQANWNVPAQVTATGHLVTGKVTKAFLQPTAEGVHKITVTIETPGDTYIQPFSFRLIAKAA